VNDATTPNAATLAELEATLADKKFARPNAWPWVDVGKLPPLRLRNGKSVPTDLAARVFAAQSREKAMVASPALASLRELVDRGKSGAFAAALLEAWLGGDQDAADRWALAVAGALGDDRVVAELLPRIRPWCDAARHKLAEYAAGAIALVGSDRALSTLDALRTRYRSKYRNVGAACAAAFERAAEACGLTPDELGDRLMPTFDCDEDGRRAFPAKGGDVVVELGTDGKFVWLDAEGAKRTKSPPKGAPAEIVDAVKALAKDVREARKAQATRLEGALVRERRWAPARFEELFVRHPFARTFAGGLVFGVYGKGGALRRSFRRYPNGVLADAQGRFEELKGAGVSVGLVHPLSLQPDEIAAWREHFARNGVDPFFPQLDRPVHRKVKGHDNRREIASVRGKTVSAGTFRGRAERLGFRRGSVVDAGGVPEYWKEFPGAGLEVVLEIAGFYIGIDPMDSIELGLARFVKAGTMRRGSYVYDELASDDPRAVRFGDVPPIVWSETIGDLAAISGVAVDAGSAT
jgi:hypothetical protein